MFYKLTVIISRCNFSRPLKEIFASFIPRELTSENKNRHNCFFTTRIQEWLQTHTGSCHSTKSFLCAFAPVSILHWPRPCYYLGFMSVPHWTACLQLPLWPCLCLTSPDCRRLLHCSPRSAALLHSFSTPVVLVISLQKDPTPEVLITCLQNFMWYTLLFLLFPFYR